MKTSDLPEKLKYYVIYLSNKDTHIISGETKENLLKSNSQFIELNNGNVINKAFIIEIRLDFDETKNAFLSLPESEKKEFK